MSVERYLDSEGNQVQVSDANALPTKNTGIGSPSDSAANADSGTFSLIALTKRLLSKLPSLVSGLFPVRSSLPVYTTSVFRSTSTNATGANWTSLVSQSCVGVQIDNNSGAEIEVRKTAESSTESIRIPSGIGGRYFSGITNADQLAIRRFDQSNTQVSVRYEIITAL